MTLDEEEQQLVDREAILLGVRALMDMANGNRPGLQEWQLGKAVEMNPHLAWLFDPKLLVDDGWHRNDAKVWVPPAPDAIYDMPVRGADISLSATAAARGNSAGGSGTGGGSAGAVADRQRLRTLPDDRLRSMKETEELRKKWKDDPEGWKHRWHSRAAVIGRFLIHKKAQQS